MARWIFVLLVLGLLSLVSCKNDNVAVKECSTDADCVPTGCCHPDACVPAGQAPDCRDIYCTMECQSGTLDCGAGKCICNEGKCGVRWKDGQ